MMAFMLLAAMAGHSGQIEQGAITIARRSLAASGNSEAALELFERYMEDNDAINSTFWLRVAAEQGNCRAIVEYSRMVGAGMNRKEEQHFWLERASELSCDLSRAVYHPRPRGQK